MSEDIEEQRSNDLEAEANSDSDSDDGFDAEEYARQREENLTTVILTDLQYYKTRSILRDMKRAEIAIIKKQLEDRTCPRYVRGKEEIESETRKLRNESMARRLLEEEASQNKYRAEEMQADGAFDAAYEDEQTILIEKLEAKLARALKREAAERTNGLLPPQDPVLQEAEGSSMSIKDSESADFDRRIESIILGIPESSTSRYFASTSSASNPGPSSSGTARRKVTSSKKAKELLDPNNPMMVLANQIPM